MKTNELKELYLDLLKKSLTGTLHSNFSILSSGSKNIFKRFIQHFISRILLVKNLILIKKVGTSQIEEGKHWPLIGETMIGLKRLDNIQYCVEKVLKNNIPGDFIETGVWRGGASIFMRALLKINNVENRNIWVADSFEGLPKPDVKKYPQDRGDMYHIVDYLKVSLDQVKENFKKYGMLDDRVKFLQGWFKDTLSMAPIEKLAIMRLDGDMYQSTWEALNNLYPKLQKGGHCIIDDYALETCKQAVDDFRASNNIKSKIHEIDWTGIYWEKE